MQYIVLENRRRLGEVGAKINLTHDQAEIYKKLGLIKESTSDKIIQKKTDALKD